MFNRLYTLEWEDSKDKDKDNPKGDIIGTAIATFVDFDKDLSWKLGEYFYCKFIFELLRRFTAHYFMCIRRVVPGNHKFRNQLTASERISKDQQVGSVTVPVLFVVSRLRLDSR